MKLSTRLTVAMVALVLLTATAVGSLSYHNIESQVLPRVLERLRLESDLLATRMEATASSARTDVAGFRAAIGLDMVVRASLAPDHMVEAPDRRQAGGSRRENSCGRRQTAVRNPARRGSSRSGHRGRRARFPARHRQR